MGTENCTEKNLANNIVLMMTTYLLVGGGIVTPFATKKQKNSKVH